MKKIVLFVIGGITTGGILGLAFLWFTLATHVSPDSSIPFLFLGEAILYLFIATGIALALAWYYKKGFDADEAIIGKHKDDNKAKDDLISMTLHHIRTPLTGMMWSGAFVGLKTTSLFSLSLPSGSSPTMNCGA